MACSSQSGTDWNCLHFLRDLKILPPAPVCCTGESALRIINEAYFLDCARLALEEMETFWTILQGKSLNVSNTWNETMLCVLNIWALSNVVSIYLFFLFSLLELCRECESLSQCSTIVGGWLVYMHYLHIKQSDWEGALYCFRGCACWLDARCKTLLKVTEWLSKNYRGSRIITRSSRNTLQLHCFGGPWNPEASWCKQSNGLTFDTIELLKLNKCKILNLQ